MYEYSVKSKVIQELFDPDMPNSPALWAVIKGNHSGEVVVENNRNPSQCVLRTSAALTYVGNVTSQKFLETAINHFRKKGSVWLVWPRKTTLKPPRGENAEVVERLEFSEYDQYSGILDQLRRQIPNGYRICTIDAELLKRCDWREEMEYYCGSIDNFLKHGVGLCMLKKEEIVVECYASSLGRTRAEIGAITRAKYRGRCLAPIACAYLIEVVEKRGYRAYWSCEADHNASIRVAQKLGFQEGRAYKIYEYEPLS